MTTNANISKFKFKLGSSGSPVTYTAIEEVFSVSGLGKTNQLEDVTNFDSPEGTMEYIAGLADGVEITIQANYSPAGTQQLAMVSAVNTGTNRQFQMAYTATSPEKTWTFEGVPLSWQVIPSPTNKNTIQFTVKVSGDITAA